MSRRSRSNPRPDLDFTPVRNGMDYLVSAVKHLTEGSTPPDARDLKYAVLHLQAATEVLLKARLVREHWSLVFKDPGGATREKFEKGAFESCGLSATMDRLVKIAGVPISDKAREAIGDLADTRNALTHYGHTANAYAVEARAARVLAFLLDFIHQQLHPALSSEAHWVMNTMDVLRLKLSGIESLVKERMKELSGELAPLAERTVICPVCRQWALVVGEDSPTCRFCLNEWLDPLDAVADYGWMVLGEDNFAVGECPICGREGAVVVGGSVAETKSEDVGLCFQCGQIYRKKDQ
ncbi:MAG TPA: hypothetical protein VK545_22810 [Streptomyces sp.]|nr:hypothetical protein [Streptomyces sp.]